MSTSLTEILIPVCASLSSAAIAGYASYIAGRSARRHESKLTIMRERISERQRLYARFIAEYDRNRISIIADGSKSIDNVMPLFAMSAEISLLSSEPVRSCAEQMCEAALAANGRESDKKTFDHYAIKSNFLEAARNEIKILETNAFG